MVGVRVRRWVLLLMIAGNSMAVDVTQEGLAVGASFELVLRFGHRDSDSDSEHVRMLVDSMTHGILPRTLQG